MNAISPDPGDAAIQDDTPAPVPVKDRENPPAVAPESKWIIRRGSAQVKIYYTPNRTPEREIPFYTISYWLNGKRVRQIFTTFKEAKAAATRKADDLDRGNHGAAKLTNSESAAYLRAVALLQPSGTSLEFAASEYASAIKRLGDVSLSQAVDSYLKRNPVHLKPKMVQEVVDEMLQMKRSDQLSARYIQQLEYSMKRFTGRFSNRLVDVSGTEVDAWLRGLPIGPRSRNNLRGSIQALFNFAISRKYLPKDHDEIDSIPLAKDRGGEIEIFTPEELAEVLAVAKPEHIPFLAISAFAGVRHAELQRMDWTNVNLKAMIIEIKAGMAKTASRRVIPIQPNLAAWITGHHRETGPVCVYANMVSEISDLTQAVNVSRRAAWAQANGVSVEILKKTMDAAREQFAGSSKKPGKRLRAVFTGTETAAEEGWSPFMWKHNALRHSYISYRLSVIKNAAEVALEAGNSPGMIFKHYHELVQPDVAKAWFGLMPKEKV